MDGRNSFTSEPNNGAHVAEHVAEGDGGERLDVGHAQSRRFPQLKKPEGQHEDGSDHQLSNADAPRQRDGVEGFL